ncbi:WD40 repeat domain-containing protein [Streptomyces sp. NPDC002573]|uniref:WD40 repeat domain-containing protein n=1 Tax=Streptomyces sp. NPDC002573 TaxID=3364651 RepID=UPI00367BB732
MLRAVEVLTINTGHLNAVRPMVVPGVDGPDLLVSITGMEPVIHAWDLSTGESLWFSMEELPGCNDAALAALPDGRRILAVSTEDGVERWNALTGDPLDGLDSSDRTIWGMDTAAFPGGRTILLGAGHNHAIYRWDVASGEEMGAPLRGHNTSVRAVGLIRLSVTDAVIVSGDDDGYLRRWDAVTGAPIGLPVEGHSSLVKAICHLVTVDGRSLFASSDAEGEISRWDAVTGERVGAPLAAGSDVQFLATACPSGTPLLFAAGVSGVIQTWHAYTGEVIDLSLSGVSVAALDQPDGTTLVAVGTARGEVVIYSVSE